MSTELTPLRPTTPEPRSVDAVFRTTRWTQVNRAKADSPEGHLALAELCAAYYEPVATFLRCETRAAEAAGDLAQEFFALVLSGDARLRAEPQRGRFRSYLLGAVKHFLAHHRESAGRLKRGGGVAHYSLHDTEAEEARTVVDTSELSPDAAFDRQWALTVLARALEALRAECAAEGRAEFFEQVKPWLTGEAAHGDQIALAVGCGMNANALKVAVHRLKRRFRRLLKEEVAGTLDDATSIEAEMQALFAALGS